MEIAVIVFALLFVLTLSGVIAKFTRIPLPILQIALGAVLAWPAGDALRSGDPALFLLVFIPPLLFTDALFVPKREFKELRLPIIGLAFMLVFLTVFVLGFGLHRLIPALPLPVAFALGAVLSPTDSVALTSIVDRQKIPPRLMHILEGEALLNDASGLMVFKLAVAATMTGHFSMLDTLPAFFVTVAGGVIAGLTVSFGASQLMRVLRTRDGSPSNAQVVLTLLLPFIAYLLAEHFEASGILAAVTAGLTLQRAGYFRHMTLAARIQNGALFRTLPFAFNGLIFLVLGAQLPAILRAAPAELSMRMPVIEPLVTVLLLTAALIALRLAWGSVVVGARRRVRRLRGHEDPGETLQTKVVISVAGVRGAVTLAGILSLPAALPGGTPFPGRDIAIFLAAGVIVSSLLLAALVLPLLTRGLRLAGDDPVEEEERSARIAAAQAAIARIEQFAAEAEAAGRTGAREAAVRLTEDYRRRASSNDLSREEHLIARDTYRLESEMRRQAIIAERAAIHQLLVQERINDETNMKLLTEVALAEALVAGER